MGGGGGGGGGRERGEWGDKLTKIPSLKRKKILVLGMGWDGGGRDFFLQRFQNPVLGGWWEGVVSVLF